MNNDVKESIVASRDIPQLEVDKSLFSKRSLVFAAIASLAYLLLSVILIGFKTDQLVLIALFNVMYFSSHVTRKFITGFSIFIVFWIIFDYMKAFPNYKYNTVHIESLYNAEKTLFGIHLNGILVTPNEYWLSNHKPFLDVITGFAYLCWVPVPLIFAGILFFRNRKHFFYFSLTFLLVNIIGFIGYYIYPAAPPWYVQLRGFEFIASTPGNTAGLARFDSFFHVSIFHGLYSKSSNVFAAMPSLHSAYPVIVLYYGLKYKAGYWNIFFALLTATIWFSAVYNSHHYVLDIIMGVICAIAGIFLFRFLANKTAIGRKWMKRLVEVTT